MAFLPFPSRVTQITAAQRTVTDAGHLTSPGELLYQSDGTKSLWLGTDGTVAGQKFIGPTLFNASIWVPNPTTVLTQPFFCGLLYVPTGFAATVTGIHAIVTGSSTPKQDFAIRYNTTLVSLNSVGIHGTGNSVLQAVTAGVHEYTIINQPIPAGQWLYAYLALTTSPGTVTTFTASVDYYMVPV